MFGTLIYGEKNHAVGYTATNPRNKQLLNSDTPHFIHSHIHLCCTQLPSPAAQPPAKA